MSGAVEFEVRYGEMERDLLVRAGNPILIIEHSFPKPIPKPVKHYRYTREQLLAMRPAKL